MKICPKCRYLDHEESGSNYYCPMCGVIYSRIGDKAYVDRKDGKATKPKFGHEKIALNEIRPSWTWQDITHGPKKRNWNFWLWVALIIAATLITAINIQRSVENEIIIPKIQTRPQQHSVIIN